MDLRTEIKQIQTDLVAYSYLKAFADLDSKIKVNINKLENIIMETKQTKFMRDLQDYKTNNIYKCFFKKKTKLPLHGPF